MGFVGKALKAGEMLAGGRGRTPSSSGLEAASTDPEKEREKVRQKSLEQKRTKEKAGPVGRAATILTQREKRTSILGG